MYISYFLNINKTTLTRTRTLFELLVNDKVFSFIPSFKTMTMTAWIMQLRFAVRV